MLHQLPIRNVQLSPCSEDWAQMTPTAQGRHCQRCNHEVIDFTQATLADLLRARTASADGRVCGRLRASQLSAPAPRLRPRQRWFLAALVLVLLQGFSSHAALAQLRPAVAPPKTTAHRPAPKRPVAHRAPARKMRPRPATPPPTELVQIDEYVVMGGISSLEVGPTLELYPGVPIDAVQGYLFQQLRYPAGSTDDALVVVRFTVDAEGRVQQPCLLQGAGPQFNAEALRVVRSLPPLPPPQTPTREASVELPIRFSPDQPIMVPFGEGLPETLEGRLVYNYVEQMPEYPAGGAEGLRQALAQRAHRPPGLADAQGQVFVRFVVDQQGQLHNLQVLKGIHPDFDQVALRVVRELGPFVPGRHHGRLVDVAYTVPVPFYDN